ncbi:gephyrin-like molybdotransferase Glp [Deinococcus yavapaiensis]|uniref:Molybdopterin molybdenumtransferase n=1 Tax=Deinococcus yavapaiensis KR-236 TaxID=694435 RepID=A0A318S7A2_9DEIO|nr:gephyrin-like molybdotransferase Glp [Deinococcus yavapaiensis]PYE53587.1 molybdopterin molybdochelatase [Deinococcus yavapaiensis KR-236]
MPPFPMFVSVEEARAKLAARLPVRPDVLMPLRAAYGRTLARDLAALVSHPSATESALDGVACRADDSAHASADTPARLKLVGESRAGAAFEGRVEAGEAIRIYTGAPLPEGADAICPVEKLRDDGAFVELLSPASPSDVRREGHDFKAGDVILRAGQRLSPSRVALAAALGYPQVPVLSPLRVAVLSTGDEVVEPGRPLAPGQVYNSNLFGLVGALQEVGAEVIELGSAPDDTAKLSARLEDAGGADLLLTSGGVSMGRYDFVRTLLVEEGEVDFWKVRVRPGGPAILGVWRGLPLFGLPGNPVSALVVFEVIVKPALTGRAPSTVRLRAASKFKSLPDKTAFWRGVVEEGSVRDYGEQGSGVLRSLSDAPALVVIPEGQAVDVGDEVEVMLLS